jgi:DNA-binding MarR family transcriptional regulator
MSDRKEKIEQLVENFQSLRRATALRSGLPKTPSITPSQWVALRHVAQRGESTVKEVAHSLGITSSAATQLIDGLVRNQYVVRKANANDRRIVTLTLSKKSAARMERMKKDIIKKFLAIFRVLSDREFDQYVILNKKLVERFLKK